MEPTNQPVIVQNDGQYLLYDASFSDRLNNEWLDVDYWQGKAEIQPAGLGRGSAWFISTPLEDYVLRHYRRGGLMARITTDRYFWVGLEHTRAWQEWKLMAHIQRRGLPGPIPLAARVVRHGLFYTADILTRRIKNTVSLSEYLSEKKLSAAGWQAIGSCIRKFHKAHIYHADLNAHNLLLDENENVYMIDFDKGRIDQNSCWHRPNLQRLRHSLDKLSRQATSFNFFDDNWIELERGYAS